MVQPCQGAKFKKSKRASQSINDKIQAVIKNNKDLEVITLGRRCTAAVSPAQFGLSVVMATLLHLRLAQFFLCHSYDHFKLHYTP